jgi:hypothetical protein
MVGCQPENHCTAMSLSAVWRTKYDWCITTTYQLQLSDVFFPPQVLLVHCPRVGHEIIKVHDNVNHGVYDTKKTAVATCKYKGCSNLHFSRTPDLWKIFYFRHLVFITSPSYISISIAAVGNIIYFVLQLISKLSRSLNVSTLSCHLQTARIHYLAKLHKYINCSCW